MKVEWAWHELKTIKENVLATEVGYGSTAKQEGTEPREFGKLNMYQAWFEHRGVGCCEPGGKEETRAAIVTTQYGQGHLKGLTLLLPVRIRISRVTFLHPLLIMSLSFIEPPLSIGVVSGKAFLLSTEQQQPH
ncbi:hypothetical protein CB1_001060003 [Camelus ferus]|nr:hypothetical protein CB1_001060003 [Camelus ferus]